MTPRLKITLAVLCLIVFCQSCYKDPALLPPPVVFPIQSIEQTPFKSFIDSVQSLPNTDLGLIRVTIVSPFFPHAQRIASASRKSMASSGGFNDSILLF